MTKKYPIIPIEGKLYMVDKPQSRQFWELKDFPCHIYCPHDGLRINCQSMACDDCMKIIASQNPSLSSLPILPPVDDLHSLFIEAGGKYYEGHELEYRVGEDFFNKGYKAAKGEGKLPIAVEVSLEEDGSVSVDNKNVVKIEKYIW